MDRLPAIPTPPSQLWREFRVRVAPLLVFAASVVAITFIWRDNVAAPNLLGEVEAIRSNVSSPKAGKLSQLNVTRLQRVKAGEVIAQVITTDPQILQSSLAVIQAEIHLLRLNLEPVLGQQRFTVSFDRLRLEWMDQRVQLVTSRVRLQLAEAEFRRAEDLFKDKVVSEQYLDTARANRESLAAEVEERSRLVAEQEQKLKILDVTDSGSGYSKEASAEDVMQASLKVQEEKLRLTEAELSPIKLTVPMDGMISAIHHRSGEAIVAGEAIVTLTALTSDRIVGYMRQPLAFQPRVGMKVEVRARSFNRCVSQAQILEIGSQMEPISSALNPASNNHIPDTGLPVLVSLPLTSKLLPGEIVDLRILPSKASAELRPGDVSQMH